MLPDETDNLEIRKSRLSGFEYSRPDISGTSTSIPPVHAEWEIYRHPDYQGMKPQPARKTYDIYSLGIVLIEIALWQSIGTIMKKDYAGGLRAIKAVKNEASGHKTRVPGTSSQGFDVEFDDVETSLDASAKLQRQYTEYVVHELRGITETL